MNFEVPPVGKLHQTSASAKPAAAHAADAVEPLAAPVAVDVSIPATPPEEVRAEMARAAERVDQLKEIGRELHFERDPLSGRIVIEVRDLHGEVIRTIPPSVMLGVVAGEPLDD